MAMLKRVISTVLTLALLLALAPAWAAPAEAAGTEEAALAQTPTEEAAEAATEPTQAPVETIVTPAQETAPAEEATEAPEEAAPTEPAGPADTEQIADACSEERQDRIYVGDTSTASAEAMASAAAEVPQFSDWEWAVLQLVNMVRYSAGVSPLTGFNLLQQAMDIRASEVRSSFSHTRPDGSSCFSVLDELGIWSYYSGENIAYGYRTPLDVMYGWMNSSGHRDNILNPNFMCLGVGYDSGAAVQMFVTNGQYTSISFVLPTDTAFPGGTTLDEMGIYAVLYNSAYGNCYLPLMSEYCTGYDPYQSGKQTVTVSVLGLTGTFDITLDIPVPSKPYKIVNTVSGVHVYWDAIAGVEKYGVWRSETGKDGTYKWLANPTVPHFTDTTAESGKTYFYRISTMIGQSNRHSEKSEAIGIAFVSTPDITFRANIAAGVQLGWNKITGATGYAIYRKSYDGTDAWVRIGTIPGNETFTWTDGSVKNNNGQVYRYTIRALAGTNMATLSGCRPAGRTMARLSSQVLTSVTATDAASAKCTWTTSSRVTGYEVRFMVGDAVYKTFTVGNWKTGVKTFTGLPAGQTCTVQVRTYKKVDGVGSFYSDWSAAKTVTLG